MMDKPADSNLIQTIVDRLITNNPALSPLAKALANKFVWDFMTRVDDNMTAIAKIGLNPHDAVLGMRTAAQVVVDFADHMLEEFG